MNNCQKAKEPYSLHLLGCAATDVCMMPAMTQTIITPKKVFLAILAELNFYSVA